MSSGSIRKITYPGPPANEQADLNEVCIDSNAQTWICTASGNPGTWAIQSAGAAKVTTPSPTSGAAFTPSTSLDAIVNVTCTTSASVKITTGPTTGAENTIIPTVTAPIGASYAVFVPAGWKVVFTGTVADFTFSQTTL